MFLKKAWPLPQEIVDITLAFLDAADVDWETRAAAIENLMAGFLASLPESERLRTAQRMAEDAVIIAAARASRMQG